LGRRTEEERGVSYRLRLIAF